MDAQDRKGKRSSPGRESTSATSAPAKPSAWPKGASRTADAGATRQFVITLPFGKRIVHLAAENCASDLSDVYGLIFDFDGLLVDTEVPDFSSWERVYLARGAKLTFEDWAKCIGTVGAFDPVAHLESALDQTLDRAVLQAEHKVAFRELMNGCRPMPGAAERISEARAAGLRVGIASSSTRSHVERYRTAAGLEEFDAIVCRDDVGRAKPDPASYREALARLNLRPDNTVAFEDSPNGIRAAKAAGLTCIAIPNALTRRLPMEGADAVLESLAGQTLPDILARAGKALPQR